MSNLKPLIGIHHVTAITSSAEKIYDFYTHILSMRLVKKNVNQDDLTSYHLYFADDRGRPGTDMTFFDFKGIHQHRVGTNDISKTSFRVPSHAALEYWVKRFDHYSITHSPIKRIFGRHYMTFEDFDNQHYALFSDEHVPGVASGEPWHKGPVPDEYAITGLGPVFLTVDQFEYTDIVLTRILNMRHVHQDGALHLYEMGKGGNGASLIIKVDETSDFAQQGYGGVHHVAFRVEDKNHLEQWESKLDQLNLPHSGFVERFYFGSVYVRLIPNILFEFATDGPGFIDDQEDYEILGETLTLPPHLRQYEASINENLHHFDTVRSNKVFIKETFDEH
ncbi:glyoxalase [Erysipelothrix larvae]|uniref:Glyoxalase n=1 Tax=Erysipelothrix larvae TaxID=1514105 RepID=A0A0X8H1S2_9FIRM|nr:VOC family protein [Erysipelothrix larvae]AMC94369.1 glyoxalase [Erysipelothrix larvae]